MSYAILMQFADNLDNDGLFGDGYKSPSVDSGTPAYTISDNDKAFDLDSAVIDIGTSIFHSGILQSGNLNIELKVDSDATDGVILSCDDLEGDKSVWVLSLIDTSSTPKLQLRSWLPSQTTSADITITIPSGNGWNNYNFELSTSTTCYYRVNGGSSTSVTFYGGIDSWDDSFRTFQLWIGKTLYGTTPSSSPLSSAIAATGVHIDWIASSSDNEGFSLNTNTNTAVRSETPSSSGSLLVGAPTSETATSAIVYPSTSIGQLSTGTVSEVQKEFWS